MRTIIRQGVFAAGGVFVLVAAIRGGYWPIAVVAGVFVVLSTSVMVIFAIPFWRPGLREWLDAEAEEPPRPTLRWRTRPPDAEPPPSEEP